MGLEALNPIATTINAASNVFSAFSQHDANKKNLEHARSESARDQRNWESQFNYMKEQNDLMRAREDSAIQRQMADMQKAGVNPLAALQTPGGAPAQAGQSKTSGTHATQAAQMGVQLDLDIARIHNEGLLAQSQANLNNASAKEVENRADTSKAVAEIAAEATKYAADLQHSLGMERSEWEKADASAQRKYEDNYLIYEKERDRLHRALQSQISTNQLEQGRLQHKMSMSAMWQTQDIKILEINALRAQQGLQAELEANRITEQQARRKLDEQIAEQVNKLAKSEARRDTARVVNEYLRTVILGGDTVMRNMRGGKSNPIGFTAY